MRMGLARYTEIQFYSCLIYLTPIVHGTSQNYRTGISSGPVVLPSGGPFLAKACALISVSISGSSTL